MLHRSFLTVMVTALASGAAAAELPSMASLDWLSGCWASDGGEPGSGEFWTPLAGDTLFGISRTVRDGRTAAHEFVQIRPLPEGGIAYIALPSGQAQAAFRLVSVNGREAVFENPDHDFPQRVGYRLEDGGRLAAWIEGTRDGETRRVDFPLTRTDCDAPSAETTLLDIAQAWVERYNRRDAAGVTALYADDGYYASAHVLARGREEIEAYWAQGIAAEGHLDFVTPIDIRVDGELGYLLGKYQATNAGVTVDGRILIVARQVGGSWKIAAHQTVVRDPPE